MARPHPLRCLHRIRRALLAFAFMPALCSPLVATAEQGGIPVMRLDVAGLDASGLSGPPGGRRALDYEYCIPEGEKYQASVRAIDPSARFMPLSRGRIGCRKDQLLVLGNTHQEGWRSVLDALAALPYVRRIEPAWFE